MKAAGTTIGIIVLIASVSASQARRPVNSGQYAHKPACAYRQEPHDSLSDTQRQALLAIKSKSELEAKQGALRLARVVQKIYNNMLSDHPDEKLGMALSNEMDGVVVELLHVKGRSIREAVRVLSPEQRNIVKQAAEKSGASADLMEVIALTFREARGYGPDNK